MAEKEEDEFLCPQFFIERGFSILELKKRLIFGNIYRAFEENQTKLWFKDMVNEINHIHSEVYHIAG